MIPILHKVNRNPFLVCPPPPGGRQTIKQKGISAIFYGGKPPGTYYFYLYPPTGGTYKCYSGGSMTHHLNSNIDSVKAQYVNIEFNGFY